MAQSSNKYAESFKAFSNYKLPSYDFNSIISIGRGNVEASKAANQAVAEGVQAIAKRVAEITKNGAEETIQLSRAVYSSKTPEASAAKLTEFARSSFENALSNLREIFEMASKSNIEAAEVLTRRLTEVMSEVGKVAPQKHKKNS